MGKRKKVPSIDNSQQESKKSKSTQYEIQGSRAVADPVKHVPESGDKKELKRKKKAQKLKTEDTTVKPKSAKNKKKQSITDILNLTTVSSKTDKPKKTIFVDDVAQEVAKNSQKNTVNSKTDKLKKTMSDDDVPPEVTRIKKKSASGKPVKMIFADDEPHETPIEDGLANETVTNKDITKEKKKFLNDDEAEVKEEDIDKFCDELDEENNKQFDEWVKLIEAKLHSK